MSDDAPKKKRRRRTEPESPVGSPARPDSAGDSPADAPVRDADLIKQVENAKPDSSDEPGSSGSQIVIGKPAESDPRDDANQFPLLEGVGENRGVNYLLREEFTTIGRAPGNTIVLRDQMLSKRHAQIRRETDGHYYLEDLQSKNGIYVNNKRTVRHRLAHGDIVIIGAQHFKFKLPGFKDVRFTSNFGAIPAAGMSPKLVYIAIALMAALLMAVVILITLMVTRRGAPAGSNTGSSGDDAGAPFYG